MRSAGKVAQCACVFVQSHYLVAPCNWDLLYSGSCMHSVTYNAPKKTRLNLFDAFGNEETECIFNPHWIIAVLCSTECLRVSLSKFIFHCSSYLILVTSTQKLKYHPGKLIFNPTQPGGTICTTSSTFTILRSAHTVYLCVLCGSENRQRLFHCTALTGWFL